MRDPRRWWPDIGAAAFLASLCVLFFWRVITPNLADRAYFPSGDFSHQFYLFALFKARQLLAGHLPLWNPYHFSGHPFLADIQSAVFYPPSLLTLLLSAPFGFSLYALEMEALFHFFLASLFTYLFARRLFRRRLVALISAVTFAYGGYLTSYPVQQLAILETDVWLPLILLILDVAWERQDKTIYILLAGLTLGLTLLAGHPQSFMYVLYISLAYLAFKAYGRRLRWPQALKLSALYLLSGLGVAAIQLVPSLEYTFLSTRAQGSYQEMAHGLPFHDFLHLFLPGTFSPWSPLYVGILPLILAVAGFWLRRKGSAFWGGMAFLALLLSLGGATFLYPLFYLLVPGFSLFRSQERVLFLFSFATAILAGYGAYALIDPLPGEVKGRFEALRTLVVGLLLGALALDLLFLYGWLSAGLANVRPFGHMLNRGLILTGLLLLSLGFLHLRRWRLVGEKTLLALALALIILDLFTINWRTNLEERDSVKDYGPGPLLAPLTDDTGVFRLYNEGALFENYGLAYGLEDIWGASPLRLRRYSELLNSLPQERVWALLNVKYVISWRDTLPVESEVLYEGPSGEETVYLHRLLQTSPRAYIVHQAEVIGDDGQALARLADPGFDPSRSVILAQGVESSFEAPAGGERVSISERRPTRMVLEVEAREEGFLVVSEVYYPGWRACLDGERVPIYRANYTLRAIPLEEGRHRVELTYEPFSFKTGLAISAFTWVTVIVALLAGFRRRL